MARQWPLRITFTQSMKQETFTLSPPGKAVDEAGNIHVVAARKEPQLAIVGAMEQPSRSTPAIAGNRIYFRSNSRLWALGTLELK